MLEKKFLEEVKKGLKGNFDTFKEDLIDLIDWAMENAFIDGISYTGYSKSNIKIQITNPRLTAVGENFLISFDRYTEDATEDIFNMEVLTDKLAKLSTTQKEMISKLADNMELLEEVRSLDEESLTRMKGILLKIRFEDKELPWDALIKLIFMMKK